MMSLLLIASFYVGLCIASDELQNVKIEKVSALFLSSAYLEERPGFESLISAKILDDCDPLLKAHKRFKTYENVEVAKRSLNRGRFPLSNNVKKEIIAMISAHYVNRQDAIDFIDSYSAKFALHEASIKKIKEMFRAHQVCERTDVPRFDYEQGIADWKVLESYHATRDESKSDVDR